MTRKLLISPSIIASDLSVFGESVKKIDHKVVDLLHVDVMDGNFVPNLTFGPGYVKALKNHTTIPFDVHLMIENPELSIDEYIEINPWCITIHYESTRFPARLLKMIREKGIKAGLSINPSTPVESVFDLLPYTDLVLIMSVDPGFYGQSFMETSLKRIKKLSHYISEENFDNLMIQVDGGINPDNIKSVVDAGASVIVAGSSAFKNNEVNKNVKDLKKKAGF